MDPQRPLKFNTVEEAGNWLKEKNKTMAADVKKEVVGFQITQMLEPDRRRFLLSALTCVTTVSAEVERAFLIISGSSMAISRNDICKMLKQIMILRIHGAGIAFIAKHLKEPIEKVASLEELAKLAVCEQINKFSGLPQIGTN